MASGREGRETITVGEAAKRLGISRGSAYQGVREGSIRAIRVGRRLLIPVAALDRLLAEGHELREHTGVSDGVLGEIGELVRSMEAAKT